MKRTDAGLLIPRPAPDWFAMGEVGGKLRLGATGPVSDRRGGSSCSQHRRLMEWCVVSSPEDWGLPRGRKGGRNREEKGWLTGPKQAKVLAPLKSHMILAGQGVSVVKVLASKPDNLSLCPTRWKGISDFCRLYFDLHIYNPLINVIKQKIKT